MPGAAVVVSTFNRSGLLPRLFVALEAQQDAPPFEVVIVDDASTDETPQVLRALAAGTSLTISVLRQAVPGKRRAVPSLSS